MKEYRLLIGLFLSIFSGVSVGSALWCLDQRSWSGLHLFSSVPACAQEGTRAVEKVFDGDTILLADNKRIRLIGIDTPEKGEPFSEEAKTFLKNRVLGQKVRLLPCKERPADHYGRMLAFVYKNNKDVGEALLGKGLARTLFVGPCGRAGAKAYRALERKAFRARLGIWSLQKPRRISHSMAHGHIGWLLSVTGRVTKVHGGPKAFYLNFGQDYRTDFTAVIFRKDISRLSEEGLPPIKTFRGKRVEVTGVIREFNGPEIIIESADQIIFSQP